MKQAVVGREGEQRVEARRYGGQIKDRIEQYGQKQPPATRYRILYEMGCKFLAATAMDSDGWAARARGAVFCRVK